MPFHNANIFTVHLSQNMTHSIATDIADRAIDTITEQVHLQMRGDLDASTEQRLYEAIQAVPLQASIAVTK